MCVPTMTEDELSYIVDLIPRDVFIRYGIVLIPVESAVEHRIPFYASYCVLSDIPKKLPHHCMDKPSKLMNLRLYPWSVNLNTVQSLIIKFGSGYLEKLPEVQRLIRKTE